MHRNVCVFVFSCFLDFRLIYFRWIPLDPTGDLICFESPPGHSIQYSYVRSIWSGPARMPSHSVCTRLEGYMTRVARWLKHRRPPRSYRDPEPRIDPELCYMLPPPTNTGLPGHSRPGVTCKASCLFSCLVGLILACGLYGSVPTVLYCPDPRPGPAVPDGPTVPVSSTDGRLGATAPSPLFRVIGVL